MIAATTPLAALIASTASVQDRVRRPDITPRSNLPGLQSGETWPTASWTTSPPEDQGFPDDLSDQIDEMVELTTPLLTSLIVVRHGALVIDNHYNGFEADEPFHIWSITKSVTAMATGIAFREGLLTDLDQTLGELIPDRIPAEADPRVANITLVHLLTSMSGWEWDGRINFSRHDETDDLELMLARPLAYAPGEGFEYDSSNSNLLSYVIEAKSGETMAEFLQPRMFDILGIAKPEWTAMNQGETRGAGGLRLIPSDVAKLGLLMLRNGTWDGEEIITPDWITESTSPQATGTSSSSGVNIGGGGAYGYQWWIRETLEYPAYYGNGYGGQTLYMVPELDLIVVTGVASTDEATPDQQQPVIPIIEELIIPAAEPM
ncbi:MAG: serine hydrolase [Thermomicrobiales bacterium]